MCARFHSGVSAGWASIGPAKTQLFTPLVAIPNRDARQPQVARKAMRVVAQAAATEAKPQTATEAMDDGSYDVFTLSTWLLRQEAEGAIDNELCTVILSIATACKQIASLVNRAGITDLTGGAGAQNAGGAGVGTWWAARAVTVRGARSVWAGRGAAGCTLIAHASGSGKAGRGRGFVSALARHAWDSSATRGCTKRQFATGQTVFWRNVEKAGSRSSRPWRSPSIKSSRMTWRCSRAKRLLLDGCVDLCLVHDPGETLNTVTPHPPKTLSV